MPKLDLAYLEQTASKVWRCQIAVPHRLRPAIGKNKLVRSLETKDLSVATLRKLKVLHEWRKLFADAERKVRAPGDDDGLMQEALEWREAFAQEARLASDAEQHTGPGSPDYVSTALEARYEAALAEVTDDTEDGLAHVG
jgi:Domain of unknown function (DUF6538)